MDLRADPVPFMEVALTLAKGLGTNTSELGGVDAPQARFFPKYSNVLTHSYYFCMVPDVFVALRNIFF